MKLPAPLEDGQRIPNSVPLIRTDFFLFLKAPAITKKTNRSENKTYKTYKTYKTSTTDAATPHTPHTPPRKDQPIE